MTSAHAGPECPACLYACWDDDALWFCQCFVRAVDCRLFEWAIEHDPIAYHVPRSRHHHTTRCRLLRLNTTLGDTTLRARRDPSIPVWRRTLISFVSHHAFAWVPCVRCTHALILRRGTVPISPALVSMFLTGQVYGHSEIWRTGGAPDYNPLNCHDGPERYARRCSPNCAQAESLSPSCCPCMCLCHRSIACTARGADRG